MSIEDFLNGFARVLFIWFMISFSVAIVKSSYDNCDVSYPVDYVLWTSLFCEIED